MPGARAEVHQGPHALARSQREHAADDVAAALAKLTARGLLNDAQYATMFARSRLHEPRHVAPADFSRAGETRRGARGRRRGDRRGHGGRSHRRTRDGRRRPPRRSSARSPSSTAMCSAAASTAFSPERGIPRISVRDVSRAAQPSPRNNGCREGAARSLSSGRAAARMSEVFARETIGEGGGGQAAPTDRRAPSS